MKVRFKDNLEFAAKKSSLGGMVDLEYTHYSTIRVPEEWLEGVPGEEPNEDLVMDKDGDVWQRQPDDKWVCVASGVMVVYDWKSLVRVFGPVFSMERGQQLS